MNFYLRHFLRSIGIGLIIIIVMLLLRWLSGDPVPINDSFWLNVVCTMLYTIALYIGNMAVFMILDRIFKEDRFAVKRVLIGFSGSFAISISIIFLLRFFEEAYINGLSFQEFLAKESPRNYVTSIVITFIISLIIHMVYFYRAYQENRFKQQKIIAGTASAKFESLKNQIDPHFLFNSLNVLSSLIEENPDNAQRFTSSLSKIYRYVLEQKDKELVSVEEELAFAKTYMNLLKMRFENSIFYEHPATLQNPDAKVVPLSLQLLLENTIKHNIVSEQKPLHIRIFEQNNYLVVQNDLQKKEVLKDRQGVGLQNIIDRYAILTDRQVNIDQNEKKFTVQLPMLTKQIGIMETYEKQDDTAYFRAKKKVEALKGFYGNLMSYCLVIPSLVFINLYFSSGFQWFWFPMLGWGMGLFIHGFSVLGYGASWEERKIRELMEKQDSDSKKNWK